MLVKVEVELPNDKNNETQGLVEPDRSTAGVENLRLWVWRDEVPPVLNWSIAAMFDPSGGAPPD